MQWDSVCEGKAVPDDCQLSNKSHAENVRKNLAHSPISQKSANRNGGAAAALPPQTGSGFDRRPCMQSDRDTIEIRAVLSGV